MRLPDNIEREIKYIENMEANRGGQRAGSPKLRGLRSAIEEFLKSIHWSYSDGKTISA